MASRPPTAAMVRARNLDERASSGVRPVSTLERQSGQPAWSGAHSRYCARHARWKSCLQHAVLKGSCGGFIELRGGVGEGSTTSMQIGHCSSSASSNNGIACRCRGVPQVSGEGRGGERHCAEERGVCGGGVPGASESCAAESSSCLCGVAGHETELHGRIRAGDGGDGRDGGDAGDSGATATLRVALYSVRGGEADRTLRRPERVGRGCASRRCLSGLQYMSCWPRARDERSLKSQSASRARRKKTSWQWHVGTSRGHSGATLRSLELARSPR